MPTAPVATTERVAKSSQYYGEQKAALAEIDSRIEKLMNERSSIDMEVSDLQVVASAIRQALIVIEGPPAQDAQSTPLLANGGATP